MKMVLRAPALPALMLPVLALAGTAVGAMGQPAPAHAAAPAAKALAKGGAKADVSAFAGRWQIDPARTRMGRNGPSGDNILRSQSFTFIFTPQGKGLKMDVYADYPQAAPTRSMSLLADDILRTCPDPTSCMTKGGVAKEQSYSWHILAPTMLARLFYIKGNAYDYSTMSVSADGEIMTLISWDPATPQYQNIQVFTKQH